jgi:asparagine synthase (glutamine-hydrolysing)
MFAFAIWDARTRELLLGRDRVGKKPLFVARQGCKLWFASEMMALLQDAEIGRTPDPRAISSYLTFQYVPHPLSAFIGVEKLPPASTLVVSESGARERRYWELNYTDSTVSATDEELAARLRELLWEATRIRLMSEVPLGAFLSGGLDSSAVVAAMADQSSEPVKTFSIGFMEDDFDELRFARIVARHFSTDHHEFVVEPNAIEIMPKLARHYGEPFADPSAIPSFYLAEMTSRQVTVALNGDGGDESFAGYNRYASNNLIRHSDWVPKQLRSLGPRMARHLGEGARSNSLNARLQRLAHGLAAEPHVRYARWISAFSPDMRADMFQPEFLDATDSRPEHLITRLWVGSNAESLVDRMLDTDVNTYLPGDLLVKMDIATMAYSLEARSPFLDHRLMEFAASLDRRHKLTGLRRKILLKAAVRGLIPREILDRKKMGFGVPLARWFRADLKGVPAELLMAADSRVHSYVKPTAIARMISDHREGLADHSGRLWCLLQLETWHREVVESPVIEVLPDLATSQASRGG